MTSSLQTLAFLVHPCLAFDVVDPSDLMDRNDGPGWRGRGNREGETEKAGEKTILENASGNY